jgi:hypothetical protein
MHEGFSPCCPASFPRGGRSGRARAGHVNARVHLGLRRLFDHRLVVLGGRFHHSRIGSLDRWAGVSLLVPKRRVRVRRPFILDWVSSAAAGRDGQEKRPSESRAAKLCRAWQCLLCPRFSKQFSACFVATRVGTRDATGRPPLRLPTRRLRACSARRMSRNPRRSNRKNADARRSSPLHNSPRGQTKRPTRFRLCGRLRQRTIDRRA